MPVTQKSLAALTEPFDSDVVQTVTKNDKDFSNVAPHHYIQRLKDQAAGDYEIELGQPIYDPLGTNVSVNGVITLHTSDGPRRYAANGSEPLTDDNGKVTNDPEVRAYAVKSAQSDAIKLAAKSFGLGLDLYSNEPVKVPKKAAKAAKVVDDDEEEAPRPTAAKSSDWEGKREKFTIPIGKHKGTTYADVEAGWLSWYTDTVEREEKNARVFDCVAAEVKYRKANDQWNPEKKKFAKKPVAKRRIDDDEDDF